MGKRLTLLAAPLQLAVGTTCYRSWEEELEFTVGPGGWERNSDPLVLKGFVGGKEWVGVGAVLWLGPEAALGGYFNSTGNAIGSAKPDFWKEGEGESGKSTLSSQPAVPGTISFIGSSVSALIISATFTQQNMLSPSLCHTLKTLGDDPRFQVAQSCGGDGSPMQTRLRQGR